MSSTCVPLFEQVFFDPALGRAMADGTITREIIDRYSVVVMAGISAEAAQNGKAEVRRRAARTQKSDELSSTGLCYARFAA